MPSCTNGCENCASANCTGTNEHVVYIPHIGCITHPGPTPPPPTCNGVWRYSYSTGAWRLEHNDGPCPKCS
jgi:hypothetical protein